MTALLARWTEKLVGGPQVGILDSSTSKSMGMGSQQVCCVVWLSHLIIIIDKVIHTLILSDVKVCKIIVVYM